MMAKPGSQSKGCSALLCFVMLCTSESICFCAGASRREASALSAANSAAAAGRREDGESGGLLAL